MKTVTTQRRASFAALLALAFALPAVLPTAARAESLLPRDEGFMKEPKSVAYRRFKLDGRNDLGVFGTFSINSRLTQHAGGAFVYSRQLNEYFAIEALLAGGYGSTTNLTATIRDQISKEKSAWKGGDDLADGGALMATGQLGLRFTPVYGKMNLSSELPVHFNFYFNAGGGASLVNFNGILSCQKDPVGGKTLCPEALHPSDIAIRPSFNVGGGLRFWMSDLLSIRFEVRDIVFPDQFATVAYKIVPPNTMTSTPGETLTTKTDSTNAGLTQIPLVFIGVGFLL